MAKTKRRALSKKTRFDVFKRDAFTCQYCGRKPPQVVLQVDHVVPVAEGGDNEIVNLLTSCEDCNRGKGARKLSSSPQSREEVVAREAERMEQTKAINAMLRKIQRAIDHDISSLESRWISFFRSHHETPLHESDRVTLKTFLSKLPVEHVHEAMDIAFRFSDYRRADEDSAWKYMCGVCWRWIKEGKP